jgi:RHS repeat-associated protein
MKKELILWTVFFLLVGEECAHSQSITPNTQTKPYSTTQTLHTRPSAYDSSIQYNFVRTYTPSRPLAYGTQVMDTTRTTYEIKQTTMYLDGLGRTFQTVSKSMSPAGKDFVTPFLYDTMGRMRFTYLPYTAADGNGSLKIDPFNAENTFLKSIYNPANDSMGEKFFYGQTLFDPFPGGRVIETTTSGNSWAGSDRGIRARYETNGNNEVRIWQIDTAQQAIPTSPGFYAKGQLHRQVIIDEQGDMNVEYQDKNGNTILKKTQLMSSDTASYTDWLCTYYVYDDLNNLRFVIPPKAVAYIAANGWNLSLDAGLPDRLCFRYDYDIRGRMIIKKIPAAGKVEIVYDYWDRQVMNRDSNMVSKGQWLVTQYDSFNRPVSIYLWNNTQNRAAHAALANDTAAYPVLSGTFVLCNQTYYDNYNWTAGTGLSSTFQASEINSGFLAPSSTVAPYPEPFQEILVLGSNPDTVRSLVTGTKTLILGTSTYLYSLNLYDNSGRVIQTQSTNVTGGVDYLTTQYSFDNRVLTTKFHQNFIALKPDSVTVLTKYFYDAAGRQTEVKTTLDSLPQVSLSRSTYNEVGQLQQKQLGQQPNGNGYSATAMEIQDYDYNTKGLTAGINRNYASASSNDRWFGTQLSYDYGFNVPGNGYFNGNIAGIIWRSKGDGDQRAFGFLYDTSNRLLKADFTQNDAGWGNSAGLDFSARLGNGSDPRTAYDANGNILFMSQAGWKISGSSLIDSLTYNYTANSNQLKNVIDGDNNPLTKLGDFRTSCLDSIHKDTTTVDYGYDGNGNLIRDLNKDIDTTGANPITYNYLNLPDTIRIKNKGRIIYTYDAMGTKLAKIVQETGHPATLMKYLGNCIYTNDSLQFIGNAEGRIRYANKYFTTGDSANRYYYDYFLRDHLGNTRVVLTEQLDTAKYIATMETGTRATEMQLFYNVDSTAYPIDSIPGTYPNDHKTIPNAYVSRVNGSLHKAGPALLLKVMSGDSAAIAVQFFYHSGGSVGSPNNSIPDVLNSLAAGLVTMTGGGHGQLPDLNNMSTSPVYAALSSFESSNDSTLVSKPKAYLNWMLLDDRFSYVSANGQSGALPIGSAEILSALSTQVKIQKNGYLYIWVSNETPLRDVFFDNLSVTTYSGPLVEETHYYPFGLTMAGISDKALKSNYGQNKYRLAGKEIQNQEFSDGSGLELYDMDFRMQDPQIGRFLRPDPLASKFASNSPYVYAEDKVIQGIDYEGLELLPLNSAWFRVTATAKTYPAYGDHKFWQEQVMVVAHNVPNAFKDEAGNPLFSAGSVNVGPAGKVWADDDNTAQIRPSNRLPKSPAWAWTEGDPDPTASAGGWYMGNNLEANKAFADRSSSVATAPQEAVQWYDLWSHDVPIWNAYTDLDKNQKSYYFAQGTVGDWGTPEMRDDIVNFVNDGTIPQSKSQDIKSSLMYSKSVMEAGFQVMKRNKVEIRQAAIDLYNILSGLLDALNQVDQQNHNRLP